MSLENVVDERLKGAQLKLVVARVQHDRLMAASDAAKAIAIQSHLDESLRGPRPMAAPGVVLQVGAVPGGDPAPSLNLAAWQYVSDENDWVATVAPDFFSLETLTYGSWEAFRTRLGQLIWAVEEVLSPTLTQRVGLRYIDELRVSGIAGPGDWAGRIAPSFLGAAHDPELRTSVIGIQQAVELQGPNRTKVTLRHGTVRTVDGLPAYLLDHDCYSDDARAFDVEDLLGEYDSLHQLALGVFQRAITADFYRQLKDGAVS